METTNAKVKSEIPKVSTTTPIRLHRSTIKMLKSVVNKINKMPYGKKISMDQLITKSLTKLTEDDLQQIKTLTYTSMDLLEMEHKKYCNNHGNISKDEFITKILLPNCGV